MDQAVACGYRDNVQVRSSGNADCIQEKRSVPSSRETGKIEREGVQEQRKAFSGYEIAEKGLRPSWAISRGFPIGLRIQVAAVRRGGIGTYPRELGRAAARSY